MLRQRPDDIRRLYEEIGPLFEQGTYRPLPLTAFAPEEIVDAFRYMSQRKNIGKVVVNLADQSCSKEDESSFDVGHHEGTFGSQGTILITGGFGALGRQVAEYAISQGTKHIAVLTRRAPEEVADQVALMQTSGALVVAVQGDVSDAVSLESALKEVSQNCPPIRGVFHAAGMLQDGLMQAMSLEQLRKVMSPKTVGAWNLHRLLSEPLDFFVLFSSVAGTIGSPGQANYAAGNAFLDGLAQHRHRLGMPASSIAWGPWDAEGMAATPEVRKQLSERGMCPLVPETALSLLDQTTRNQTTQVAVMDVAWNVLLGKLIGGGSSLFRDFAASTTSSEANARGGRDEQLFEQLKAATPDQRLEQLKSIVAIELSDVMGIEAESIETDQPLVTLGLDSLMGMELKAKLESKLGIEIPMSSLFDDPSVASLALVASASYGEPGQELSVESVSLASQPSVAKQSEAPIPRSEAKPKSGLVVLGSSRREGTPLFCLHPVGGDLRCYDSVARAIKDRPVFGLRAQGLHAGSTPHESMDAMVDDYINAIREECTDGPYCLLGWSTGGIFAYEIARRLQEQQLPVQPVIMIDTPLPVVFEKVDQNDGAKFLVDLVEFANHFAGTSMKIDYKDLHQLGDQEAVDIVLALSIEHGVLPAQTTSEYLERLINVCKQHVSVLQSYQTPSSDLLVEMLRPETAGVLSNATGHSLAEDLGWGAIAQLRLHQTPGNHFTMMTAQYATLVADRVVDLLGEPSVPSV